MSLCRYSKEYTSTSYTNLENVFIYEYLPEASGLAVKVYTYGLFLCQNVDFDISLKTFSENLKLSEDEVTDAFKYWEEFGLLSIASSEPFSVIYYPIHGGFNSKPKKLNPEKYSGFAASLEMMLQKSRMIEPQEFQEYFYIMDAYGIKPEAMLMIVKYCVDLKGDSVGCNYIKVVAKNFGARKILTVEQLEKELSSYVLRSNEIEKILKAIGLKRRPEIDDLTYLKKWTGELNFEIENILFAASKVKKGGFKKLDEFLLELYSAKAFSKGEITNYTKNKDNLFDLAIKINKTLGVYSEVLDTVVENYTSKWVSFGYKENALLLVANYCFKRSKKSLEDMDVIIESLFKKGLIDYDSIADYFVELSVNDKFISEILSSVGANRKPNNWDRENLKIWRNWNFSDEMIIEASKLSSGKSNPIPYINAILGSWKNKNIFRVEDIVKSGGATSTSNAGFKNERKYSDEEIGKIIENIADIEF